MTNDQLNEARKLVAQPGGSIRKAAQQLGLPYSTLRRVLSKDGSEPEPEPQSTQEHMLRRYEDENRKYLGLPPITDQEWLALTRQWEECQEIHESRFPYLKDLPSK